MEYALVAGIASMLGFVVCALFASNAYDRGYRDATRYWQHDGRDEGW